MSSKSFLFLQGPISPFFPRIADRLEQLGHSVHRINLCLGDWLFWRRPGAVNFRGKESDWPAFVADFLDRHGVTDIVLLGEQRPYHKAALEAARRRGLRVTVTDFGYIRPDFITLEKDGMSAASSFPRDPAAIRALAAQVPPADLAPRFQDSFNTMARWDVLYHVSTQHDLLAFPNYKTHQLFNPTLAYFGTLGRLMRKKRNNRVAEQKIDNLEKVPFFVFPLQMETDYQIRVYSPFRNLKTPIELVIGSFAANARADDHLVIKVHPLDPGLTNWRRLVKELSRQYDIGDRVHYLDGGNLDRMLRVTRGVVTINSTVGIRTLHFGRPLIVLGDAIYKIPGLIEERPLDAFWRDPTPPDLGLRDAFFNAMAATIHVRGVYYAEPGLQNAIEEATFRLDQGLINMPLQRTEDIRNQSRVSVA